MELGTILAAATIVAAAVASWMQGRKSGLQGALTTASDVVGMLAAQVGEQRTQLSIKDAQIEQLRLRIQALEGRDPSSEPEGEGDSEGGPTGAEGTSDR